MTSQANAAAVLPGSPVNPEPLDPLANQATRVRLANLEPMENQAARGSRDMWVNPERTENKGTLGRLAARESMALPEQRELQGQRDLPVSVDPGDLLVNLGTTEGVVKMATSVPLDLEDSMERGVLLEGALWPEPTGPLVRTLSIALVLGAFN